MKEIFMLFVFGVLLIFLSGCNTVTYYDADGKVTKVERHTDFSRVMDGTNAKSQIVLVDGVWCDFEASATVGENLAPGIKTKYASGKTAFINMKDNAKLTGAPAVVEKFFSGTLLIGKDGIKKE